MPTVKAASCESERTWGDSMAKALTAVALGLFDGVHLGHRAVLDAVCAQRANGLTPSVFTFEPESVLRKSSGSAGFIYGMAEKSEILRGCGIENICVPHFDDVCGLSGEEFVKNILRSEMNAAFVSCGRDFRFGFKASCGVDELRKFGKIYGFEVDTVDDVMRGGEKVSSSIIRRLISEGDIKKADRFLAQPYMILREVVHGAALGHTIGFPTINQLFSKGQLVPKFGVYASMTKTDGGWKRSMTNIGIKPTVNYSGTPLAETFITDFSGDVYGRALQVVLTDFIRPEMKFPSVDALKKQISADITAIKSM